MTGTACDAEDGDLTGSLAWSSNLDGALGTGESVSTSTLAAGVHTITASVTDSGDLTGSDGVTITVTGTVHIHDIDGIGQPSGRKKWKATVSLTVHDTNEVIVENAEVFGTWSGGVSGTGSCITGIEGQCSLTSRPIANLEEDVTFTVDNVTHATMSYDAEANHDEDGDSTGTVIIVDRP